MYSQGRRLSLYVSLSLYIYIYMYISLSLYIYIYIYIYTYTTGRARGRVEIIGRTKQPESSQDVADSYFDDETAVRGIFHGRTWAQYGWGIYGPSVGSRV